MKKLQYTALCLFLAAVLATSACATNSQQLPRTVATADDEKLPTMQQYQDATDSIAKNLMKAEHWCVADIPPHGKKGDITVFYRPDAKGNCVPHFKVEQ